MSKELTIIENYSNHPALTDNFQEVIEDNLGSEGLKPSDLNLIKIPTGGSTKWTIDTLEGEELVSEIEGIIIMKKTVRAYWKNKFGSSDQTMPDCLSRDGKFGEVQNVENAAGLGELCKKCPMNQYGSATEGKGKACKENTLLFVMLKDELLPTVIRLSPGSLKNAKSYFVKLVNYKTPYWKALTKITLSKEKNEQGINFSMVNFAFAGRLDEDTAKEIANFKEQFKQSLVDYEAEDIYSTTSEGTNEMINKPAEAEMKSPNTKKK